MDMQEIFRKLRQHDESDGHIFDLPDLLDELEAEYEARMSQTEYSCLFCSEAKLKIHNLEAELSKQSEQKPSCADAHMDDHMNSVEQSEDSKILFVGHRVHFNFPREPALRDVPDVRLCSDGLITAIFLHKGKAKYRIRLDREVLGEHVWQCDAERISLIKQP